MIDISAITFCGLGGFFLLPCSFMSFSIRIKFLLLLFSQCFGKFIHHVFVILHMEITKLFFLKKKKTT